LWQGIVLTGHSPCETLAGNNGYFNVTPYVDALKVENCLNCVNFLLAMF
jgi:hypothetical protein